MLLFSTTLKMNEKLTRETFIQSVVNWNLESPHEDNIIPGLVWNGEMNHRFGSENLWLDIQEYRNENIIAIRFEKKEKEGAFWDTDYIMNFQSMNMTIRLYRTYSEQALEYNPKFSTPVYLKTVIDEGFVAMDNNLPVLREPIPIDRSNLDILIKIIKRETQYHLPIVFVSRNYNDELPIDAETLAWKLKGIAHVLVEDNKYLNEPLSKATGGQQEYYGAVGVYFPNRSYARRGHLRFLCRTYTDVSDKLLMKRVFDSVLKYTTEQNVGPLATWGEINTAINRDRWASSKNERQNIETEWRKAQETIKNLEDSKTETERRIRKEAQEKAMIEAEKLVASCDSELTSYRKTIDEQAATIARLTAENEGLHRKLSATHQVPVLYLNEELELFEGEIKEHILQILEKAGNQSSKDSRRAHICKDIVNGNNYQGICSENAEELKRLLRDYQGLNGSTRKALEKMGFKITEDGKHYKLCYYGDDRYIITLGKTPSDLRAGKNNAALIINKVY